MPAIADAPAHSLAGHADALPALVRGELDAILVRGALQPEALERIVARLDEPGMLERLQTREHPDPTYVQVQVLGEPVSPSNLYPEGPDPETYFAAADPFRALLERLFEPEPSFVERARELLGAMAGGARAAQLSAEDGRPYGSVTLRRVPPGCDMGAHCENLYRDIDVLQRAGGRADLAGTFSYFVPLQLPEAGGTLALYGGEPPAADTPALELSPGAGDMLVFPAGPRFHRVTPVRGTRVRWTIGGFGAYSPDGATLWLWG